MGLAVNPKNVVTAAKNLAWIHSEHGGKQAKDKALALAQMAKQVARGVYQRALALLREGAARLPDNAELQYHLGMAAARTGDRDLGRKALAFAAASPAAFTGKDEAKRTLAELRGVHPPMGEASPPPCRRLRSSHLDTAARGAPHYVRSCTLLHTDPALKGADTHQSQQATVPGPASCPH